jgi:quercetin dioxygenase-like cupin family protein
MATAGRFDDQPAEEPYPGVRRHTVHSEHATVAEYAFEPGASFPLHAHPQEQVTLVLEGDVELTAAGRTERLAAGAWSVVPGGVEHGATAGAGGARIVAFVVPRRGVPP